MLAALQAPPVRANVEATLGAKISVGVADVFIAWLNVTAMLKVSATASESVITRSFATTSTTVGLERSIATTSSLPTPGLPLASCQAVPTVTEPMPEKPAVAVKVAV